MTTMTEDVSVEVSKSDISEVGVLPPQVKNHFNGLKPSEEAALSMLYWGKKDVPNFTDWLEGYVQNTLFETSLEIKDRIGMIKSYREKHLSKRDECVGDDEEKKWQKELERVNRLLGEVSRQHLDFIRELNKSVQSNLQRETPKKVQVQKIEIKPSDIAKMMRETDE